MLAIYMFRLKLLKNRSVHCLVESQTKDPS